MADEDRIVVSKGTIAIHVSIKNENIARFIEALDKSKLANDELIKPLRARLHAMAKQKGAK
jgi:hypothetical protein